MQTHRKILSGVLATVFALLLLSEVSIGSGVIVSPQYFYPPNTTLYWKDDFIPGSFASGGLGENSYVSGGGVSVTTGTSNHPGIVTLDTSAVANTNAFIIPAVGSSSGDFLPSEMFSTVFIQALNTNDANTTQRFGVQTVGNGNPPSDGIYIEKLAADTQWFCVTRAASAQTRTVIANADTSFHTFRIRRISTTSIGCQIDTQTEIVVSTNIPTTAAVRMSFQLINTAAVAKNAQLDFWSLLITGMNR